MLDFDKLNMLTSDQEVSDELLAAYIDGNTTEEENIFVEQHIPTEEIDTIIETTEDCQSFQEYISVWDGDYGFWELGLPPVLTHDGEINTLNQSNISFEFPICKGEILGDTEITKYYNIMKDILSIDLNGVCESYGNVGSQMSVGENAMNVTSAQVLQSYADTCAIKSQQLVLEKYGIYRTEDQLVQQAYENGWYRPGGGTHPSDLGEILKANGVPCTNYEDGNIAQVVSALADGKQIIMGVDSGELWETSHVGKLWERIEDKLPLVGGADHALMVTGIDASDPSNVKVIVTDPGTGDLNKTYPLKQFIDAAEDSKFFMTVTDVPTPNIFDALAPGTTHLPMIGDMNYYEFMNKFSNYMHDGDTIPDDVWNDFKLSAFGASETDTLLGKGVVTEELKKEVSQEVDENGIDNEEDKTSDDNEDEDNYKNKSEEYENDEEEREDNDEKREDEEDYLKDDTDDETDEYDDSDHDMIEYE